MISSGHSGVLAVFFISSARSCPYSCAAPDDDLYEGYNTAEPRGPPQNPPMTGMRPPMTGTASVRGGGLTSRAGVVMSRSGMGASDQENRPMTAVRAAGYTTAGNRPGTGMRMFDPMGAQQGRGPAPPLQKRSDNSPEDKCREMEKEVNGLIEESARLALNKQYQAALDRAKEAGKLERQLCKKREEHGLADQINIDLTCARPQITLPVLACDFDLLPDRYAHFFGWKILSVSTSRTSTTAVACTWKPSTPTRSSSRTSNMRNPVACASMYALRGTQLLLPVLPHAPSECDATRAIALTRLAWLRW